MLPKIKAKECCCGCTLRTGSLILLWIVLVGSATLTVDMLKVLHLLLRDYLENEYIHYIVIIVVFHCYYLVKSIIATITSGMGIFAIEKDISKYLTPFLYYLGYEVIWWLFGALFVIVFPSLYGLVIWGNSMSVSMNGEMLAMEEFVLVALVGHLFCITLLTYLWIIIRSFRDSMQNNVANGVDTMSYSKAGGYYDA